jgi:hypothetical protein
MEEMSFNSWNYACYVPDLCRDVRYAPRLSDENVGKAWWKTDECVGMQTRHPTVRPTPRPTYPLKEDSVQTTFHDNYYKNSIPEGVALILEKSRIDIEQNVLIRRTVNLEWEASSIYKYDELIKALGVMTMHAVRSGNFYMGDGEGEMGTKYALVHLAAFLAHSMAESIKYDHCDEPNWEQVNGRYPLSNACGQGGKSYQDMTCPEDERHMECPVKKDMTTRAVTHANWGDIPGAPTFLYCQPKSLDGTHFTGFWDHEYKCDRPFAEPPETCSDYEGQTAGRIDNSVPAANMAARVDVEGCCFWGRGVIRATGTCSIGRLNYFLGKGAADKGRPSPYPEIDFCEDPEIICGSAQHAELKWVAGLSEWVEQVQSYSKGDFSYLTELKRFVNGGMLDDTFITNVSKILQHGCHGEDTCFEADGAWERGNNFKRILTLFRLEIGEVIEPASSSGASTSSIYYTPAKQTSEPTMQPTPTPRPTPRVTRPLPSTGRPTNKPSPEPTHKPTFKPTQPLPWYINYDLRTCVNDGKQPSWTEEDKLFPSKELCCSKHYGYKSNYYTCISDGADSDTIQIQPNQESQDESGQALSAECPPDATGWHTSPDCKSFFMCKKGGQFGMIMKCDEGYLFDDKTHSCRVEYMVICKSSAAAEAQEKPMVRPTSYEASTTYHSKTRPST